ncbi:hypothetical protein EJ03DRAFT_348778 [Teratosphaeria nubilosa]|uniref:Uncharacterized protein n=1 Tax=Teratosphaeria nubilosa TaxID=161662 RepID=A0A6G1LIF8_9PEZI|nr:hypothetical protein EJ03DRAFT_348778 [Teratosphaeria nubilosa]
MPHVCHPPCSAVLGGDGFVPATRRYSIARSPEIRSSTNPSAPHGLTDEPIAIILPDERSIATASHTTNQPGAAEEIEGDQHTAGNAFVATDGEHPVQGETPPAMRKQFFSTLAEMVRIFRAIYKDDDLINKNYRYIEGLQKGWDGVDAMESSLADPEDSANALFGRKSSDIQAAIDQYRKTQTNFREESQRAMTRISTGAKRLYRLKDDLYSTTLSRINIALSLEVPDLPQNFSSTLAYNHVSYEKEHPLREELWQVY